MKTGWKRRIGRLEATFTDATGLVPHSPVWNELWRREIERTAADPDYFPRPLIPLEAFRSYIGEVPTTP